MFKEFKEFAIKGNVIDLAVGLILGAAFGTIVSTLVEQVLMPPIGMALGNVDFSGLMTVLRDGTPPPPYATYEAAVEAGAVAIGWGSFINEIISFLIVAFAVFMLVRWINQAQKAVAGEVEAAPDEPALTADQQLLAEIRDLLKARTV